MCNRSLETFNGCFTEPLEFKEKYGHCQVPQKRFKEAEYYSLGHWLSNVRSSYKAIQSGEKPKYNISEAEIKRLDDIGFQWVFVFKYSNRPIGV